MNDTYTGEVTEVLPNGQYRVELQDGRIVRCYTSGKMRQHRISVIIGDSVEFVWPRGSAIGRVVRRLRK